MDTYPQPTASWLVCVGLAHSLALALVLSLVLAPSLVLTLALVHPALSLVSMPSSMWAAPSPLDPCRGTHNPRGTLGKAGSKLKISR